MPIVFCTTCGAYAMHHVRNLCRPCGGKPGNATFHARLLAGLHPIHKSTLVDASKVHIPWPAEGSMELAAARELGGYFAVGGRVGEVGAAAGASSSSGHAGSPQPGKAGEGLDGRQPEGAPPPKRGKMALR